VSRRRCISSTLLLLATLGVGACAGAQAVADEAQIKAAFVYNFLKFVEWPAGAFAGPYSPVIVAIIGDGPTADATAHFLALQRLDERQIVVRRVKEDQSLVGVHAAFVTEHDPWKLSQVLDSAASAGVLSIGEGEEFAAHGGVIALLVESRRVRFDIDLDAARAAGLQISSQLLALTRIVYTTTNVSGTRP
jgi:hypothetical protein